jgi:hypothetical protein
MTVHLDRSEEMVSLTIYRNFIHSAIESGYLSWAPVEVEQACRTTDSTHEEKARVVPPGDSGVCSIGRATKGLYTRRARAGNNRVEG